MELSIGIDSGAVKPAGLIVAARGRALAMVAALFLALFWGPKAGALAVDVNVDAGTVLRDVPANCHCLNTPYWDPALVASQGEWSQAGAQVFRWPGGSDSDSYDFSNYLTVTPYAYNVETPAFADMVQTVGGQAYITLNYGSGSPQMAAAFIAYLDGDAGDATVIGEGNRPSAWNGSGAASSSAPYYWQTVGFWASLRGQSPLATDDGFNHLRVDHPAAWGFKYFEIGNETFGPWENDLNPCGQQQDPYVYAAFAQETASLGHEIAPGLLFAVPVVVAQNNNFGESSCGGGLNNITDPVSGQTYNGWTPNLFRALANQGYVPDIVIIHTYPESPGSESDSLLLSAVSPPSTLVLNNLPESWAGETASVRGMLSDYLGTWMGVTTAAAIQLHVTEHNSVSSSPGKQTTSLVNGLFIADSFGGFLLTELQSLCFWASRQGAITNANNSSSLYGWRDYGDYALFGRSDDGQSLPGYGVNIPYPDDYALQLTKLFAQPGDQVVQAASTSNTVLTAYACMRSTGDLTLLVVNKDPGNSYPVAFNLSGFTPSGSGTLYQYGEPQDTEQESGGTPSLAASALSGVINGFSVTFPPYSMSVIDLGNAQPKGGLGSGSGVPAIEQAVAVPNPNPSRLSVDLRGGADRVVVLMFTKAYVLVGSAQSGPLSSGWGQVPLGARWSGLPSGTYFLEVKAYSGDKASAGVLVTVVRLR